MKYLAHVDTETGREQLLIDHLTGTAKKAAEFAAAFNASEQAKANGVLHDIGKYSDGFQKRIRGSRKKVDHSTAGALVAFKDLKDVPGAFCIAGHHGGLPDKGTKIDLPDNATLLAKLKRREGVDIENYSAYKKEVEITSPIPLPDWLHRDNASLMFYTRMIYSCLVDADFLDTEEFMREFSVVRGNHDDIQTLNEKLTSYIEPWWSAESDINRQRCEILKTLIDGGVSARGIYSLTVPTGGGKTVSSMAFALKHILSNSDLNGKLGMRRVIYVIPYTSIIEQTQSVFEKIFGEQNVIAHFANVEYSDKEDDLQVNKRKLASENWDAPIILTTAVQFFESLYANRSSRCRKLHNIANSVIIFDEAQMMPVPYLNPCIAAVSELIKNYGCTGVLCTATQPSLGKFFNKYLPNYQIHELCHDIPEMYDFFRRVKFIKLGKLSNEALTDRLLDEKQVLCVVNNRKQAQKILSLLGDENSYHLSTTMYPAHRRRVLTQIRKLLEAGLPCRVVSTSLIEAGVDVDFPTVYRAVAGLDSIIQTAGRCNREGKRSPNESIVYIFDTEQEPPQMLQQNIAAAREVIANYDDISSPQAIEAYFRLLYDVMKDESAFDVKKIMKEIVSGTMAFETIANEFHIIENAQCTVFVPLENGAELAEQLREEGMSRNLIRQLSQYSVGVYPRHFSELKATGAIDIISENSAILLNTDLYSEKTGLSFSVEEGKGYFY